MSRLKVKRETTFTYTNKFNQKKVTFTPSTREIVATFKEPIAEDTARAFVRDAAVSISQGLDPTRGFAVLQVSPGKEARAVGDSLEQRPEIANTLPVMTDDEGLTRYFLPDEFTVQFKKDVTRERAAKVVEARKSQVLVAQRTPGYYTLAVPEGQGLFETLREFSDLPEVAFAEPSEAGFNDALLYVPDDADFPKLWALDNTGQLVNGVTGVPDADIDATDAWSITRGDPEVVVAVVDTGADLNHPDLMANLLPRGAEDWDFADCVDPSPDDMVGHGTHVCGTVAATDNTQGVIGVAPLCRLMPLRVNLTTGMNQNRADAINYVAAQAFAHPERRYVINGSWKMSGDHAGVHNAIMNAAAQNVLVVFAAGNYGLDIGVTPLYPAVYPEVLAVAALDQRDRRASFSNYGGNVAVSAPGVNIYSTFPDDGYTFMDGTSMAAPHVAGLAALVWSKNHSLTAAEVRGIVEATCDNVDARNPGFAGKLGHGRINAYHAVQRTPIEFKLLRRMPFPQANSGSSSALGFARRLTIRGVPRPVLMFLTQEPYSERIYYLDPLRGLVLGSVDPVANDTIGSLEWTGRAILVANVTTGAGFINTIDPFTGAQLASMPVPPGRGEGMAFDGRSIYYSTISTIHVIDAATGAVLRGFPAPGGGCRSLAWGHGRLFCGGADGVIRVIDLASLDLAGSFPAPGGGTARAEGLAFNPATRELFTANQSENTIYVGIVPRL